MSDYRERSRSPHHSSSRGSRSHEHKNTKSRSRSHSPKRSRHKRSQHRHRKYERPPLSRPLPLDAQPLSKSDLSRYRPLLALYLDIQKQLDIEDLSEDEIKGRWKSFVKKWNAGDLAEGWYDAETFEKAIRGVYSVRDEDDAASYSKSTKSTSYPSLSDKQNHIQDEDEDDDQEFGPALPRTLPHSTGQDSSGIAAGPSVPSIHDLRVRDEEIRESVNSVREFHVTNIRAARKADRNQQRERLEEVVPRADPGSRERQLEKKRDMAASNRAFAASKEAGGDVELRDADVMGEEDSLGELRRMKEMEQRKKTEREVRREELLRARNAEREEKMQVLREKETKTMEMLKSIARARFGGDS